ncbi:MAG: hypothetical protein WCL06_11625 [Bacteroidota bacterium]
MEDLSVILQGLEYKMHQLIKRLEEVKNENIGLKAKLNVLQKSEEENILKIKYLEEKNNIIKIANSVEGPENKTKAKLRINEVLREVDRCLALLNK